MTPQHLPGGETTRFPVGDTGGKSRVQAVHIEGNVKGCLKVKDQVITPAFHFDDFHTKSFRLFALVSIDGADANLHQPVDQPGFHDARKGAGVGTGLPSRWS